MIREGCYRIVFLIGKYAIKIPNFRYEWRHFIYGIYSNIQEYNGWTYTKNPLLCPVIWKSFGCFIIVMKRCDPISSAVLIDYEKWEEIGFGGDDKHDNYGYLNGRIVKLDYS